MSVSVSVSVCQNKLLYKTYFAAFNVYKPQRICSIKHKNNHGEDVHTHALTHKHTHKHTHTHTHLHTHTNTHTHTRAQATHKQTHACTQTHKQVNFIFFVYV